MTDYKEDIDEFAPAKELDVTAPAKAVQAETEAVQAEPEQVKPVEMPNAYNSIIEQQTAQIDALIAQNQSLTEQITKLIQSGAQLGSAQPMQQVQPMQRFNTASMADNDDWSLESLAKDIGKRPTHR